MIYLQKRAVRIILDKDAKAHTADLFKELRIMPLKALIEYNVIMFMNDNRRNLLPALFKDGFPLNHEVRHVHYILRNCNDHHIVKARFEYLKRFPFILFPETWNNFMCFYRDEDYRPKFSSLLKDDLILRYTVTKCYHGLCRLYISLICVFLVQVIYILS